jgi:hypothetical protein
MEVTLGPILYEEGFREGIQTALSVIETRGYDRALKTLRKILENSQSRPPRSSQESGGHDTTEKRR